MSKRSLGRQNKFYNAHTYNIWILLVLFLSDLHSVSACSDFEVVTISLVVCTCFYRFHRMIRVKIIRRRGLLLAGMLPAQTCEGLSTWAWKRRASNFRTQIQEVEQAGKAGPWREGANDSTELRTLQSMITWLLELCTITDRNNNEPEWQNKI